MAKIRYLKIFDIVKLKKLASHITSEKFLNLSEFFNFPFALINQLLPISLKYMSESYVALYNGEVKAMLTTKARKKNHAKWEIKRLLLAPNASEIGVQLINFVVSKYGAKGVETIEVKINETETDIIELFSKDCGFRYCLGHQIFKIDKEMYTDKVIYSQNSIFRPYKSSDLDDITDLFNQNILPYYKFPLSKSKKEFKESIFRGLYKASVFKFILEDKFSKQIRGFVQIETIDNYNYLLEIVLLPSYENYFQDAICFAASQIAKRTHNFSLFFRNNKFHVNSNEYEKILQDMKCEVVQNDMIFVKDFFKQIKEDERIMKPAMIYNQIKGKPAFKN